MRLVVRAVLALSVVTLVLGLVSCGTSEATGNVVRVKPVEAVRLIADGHHTVIDLRSSRAFLAGHVAGARNIDASAPDFEERIARLDDGLAYLVYARTRADSAPAADAMVRAGIDQVVDAGAFGMLALAGAPLES